MTLPASGTITYDDFAGELGVSGSIVFPSDITRWLAEKSAGDLVLPTDYHGKQGIKVEAERTSPTGTNHSINGVAFGPAFSGRRLRVIFFCVEKPSGTVPTGTQNITNISIGGTGTSNVGLVYYQGGSGSTTFAGVATASITKASETSGTISFTTPFSTDVIIVVLSSPAPSNSAFDNGTAFSSSASGLNTTIDVPDNGALIAFANKKGAVDDLSWSGVTEKNNLDLLGYRLEYAFTNRLSSESGRSFGFTSGGSGACVLGGITVAF